MGWQTFIPGFLLGCVSSFHCIGMCGPIAMLLPLGQSGSMQKTKSILLYNTGRLFTYTVLGIFFGLAGRRAYIAGMQQGLSVLLGIIIFTAALIYFIKANTPVTKRNNRLVRFIQQFIASRMKKQGWISMTWIGMANGLLPCGMVYFAVAGALATSSVTAGGIFMFSFGIGTMVLMVPVAYLGVFMTLSMRNKMKRSVPFFVAAMGMLLILRGMNLNIPYVSPMITRIGGEFVQCH